MKQNTKLTDIEETLHTLQQVTPDAGFVKDLRTELISKFPAVSASYGWTKWIGAFLIVLVLFGLVGTGVVIAAFQSKPGELLYPIKGYLETALPVYPVHTETKEQSVVPQQSVTPTPIVQSSEKSETPSTAIQPVPTTIAADIQLEVPAIIPQTSGASLLPTSTPAPILDANIKIQLPLLEPTPAVTASPITPTPAEQADIIDIEADIPVIGKIKIGGR